MHVSHGMDRWPSASRLAHEDNSLNREATPHGLNGQVAEWFKEPVLKTGEGWSVLRSPKGKFYVEEWPSGLRQQS